MNKDLQKLYNFLMNPYFEQSSSNGSIDNDTYMKNYAKISMIHGYIKNLDKKLKHYVVLTTPKTT